MERVPQGDLRGQMQRKTMEYIINHVILPPQLPQKDDYNSVDERWLLHHALEAFKLFRGILQHDEADVPDPTGIQYAFAMLDNLASICSHAENSTAFNEKAFQDSLNRLHEDVAPIPLYIHAQNAGVIISSAVDGDKIHFELFELLPLNKAVMGNAGRLQRAFPGCAIAVPREEVQKPAFLRTISETLATMSHQPAYGTTPKVKKAGQMHQEDRDTTHPKMVTELLAAYLRSVGDMVEVSSILKNTREAVLWKDARSPWHRSALWLLTRVALELFFSRRESDLATADTYKNYMLLFMGYILLKARKYEISTDLVWSIKAKLTRRRLKLGACGHPGVLRFVDGVLSAAGADLERRWSRIQSNESILHDFSDLKDLPAAQDTNIHLEELDEYLEAIEKREYCTQSPKLVTSCPLPDFTTPLHKSFNEFPSATPTIFKLLKFESWVESSLDAWLTTNLSNKQTCEELKSVIESYHAHAVTQYQDNPEAMSVMFLTIMRLWVALDQSAISHCILLADYAPHFPVEILWKLILPEKCQMKRLQSIEQHLAYRSSQAKFSADHIFYFYGKMDCFAVRYFNQSVEHQNMLSDIERRAEASKDQKCVELTEKRNDYQQHLEQYDRLECQYTERLNNRTGAVRQKHKPSCERCKHKVVMDAMKIQLHEWPLPENKNEAKTVVFELLVPAVFGCWRDSTIFALTNVLGLKYVSRTSPRSRYTTETIREFSGYIEARGRRQRISLLSEKKPHSRTHRNVKSVITVPIEEICVKNGMAFRYFDNTQDCFVNSLTCTSCLTHACTLKLSKASEHLQQFLDGTVEPNKFSNTAIATQSACPLYISLEEYKGMASLRAGSKVRWHNLLKELASPSVEFGKEDTVLIILQCIQQAGQTDTGNALRETHSVLDDDRFSAALLNNLSSACSRVSGNWQSAPALSAFISIASRVLSLSPSPGIQQVSLKILATARAISISWVEMLKRKAEKATEDRVRGDFLSKSTFVALICADSFNVSNQSLRKILCLPEQATILIQTAIVIQENGEQLATERYSLTTLLYHRWKRLCLRSFPIIAEKVVMGQSPALDDAIKTSWAAYQPVSQWHSLEPPHEHWLKSKQVLTENGDAMLVQFSMLTGELLVNGVPLNRLPEEYERTPVYQRLFGNSMIEAMPSCVRGMRFSGKQTFAGHKLHFNLSTKPNMPPGSCLWILASNQESTFELIPSSLLRNKFPVILVDNFIHWYNVTEDCVEFCPQDRPWFHSNENWKLYRVGESNAWKLTKGEKSLVNIQSRTAKRLAKIFEVLEDVLYIHITLDHKTSMLEIDLPRIQLGFSTTLVDKSIRCHQHRGMVVHEQQIIGTLVGLQSKLVLRTNKSNSRDKIIVPNGNILHHDNSGHIRVTIDKASSTKTQTYEIDRRLGRIIDNGTMTSKLVLAYLHGLTSFCLPDPLTGSTGTNAALGILRSAAVRSFPTVKQEDVDLLVNIANLAPGREYYPAYLKEMETVHWSPKLGFLAQHIEYYECVNSLFEHFRRSNLFRPEHCVKFPNLRGIDKILLQREKNRSAVVRAWDFGAEYYTQKYDEVYSSRDLSQNSKEALKALSLSSMIFQGQVKPQEPMRGDIGHHLWQFLRNNCKVLNASPLSSRDSFRYSATFLIEPSKIIAKELLVRLRALKIQEDRLTKYKVMLWLSTLSFAELTDMTILQVLASFFICPQMSAIKVPYIQSYDLSYGFQLEETRVKDKVLSATHDFRDTPDAHIEKYEHETDRDCLKRRTGIYQDGVNRTVSRFVKGIIAQWPCKAPRVPTEPYFWEAYIDVDQAMQSLGTLFQITYNNYLLHKYLEQVGNNVPRASFKFDALVCMPTTAKPTSYRARSFVNSNDVFAGPAPFPISTIKVSEPDVKVKTRYRRDSSLLPNLLIRLDEIADSLFEMNYMANLRDSLSALHGLEYGYEAELGPNKLRDIFFQYREEWQCIVNERYSTMITAVTKPIHDRLCINGLKSKPNLLLQHFPQPCPVFFLQYLSRKRWRSLPEGWKKCVIHYGVVLTQLQRADRLLDAVGNPASLMKELNNLGHQNWDPYEYPDSLLLEIENGILIRDVQEQIAAQMKSPLSDNNVVMQLNMGEGKSSVIVPIVATSLADTTRLVRVVVAKPQSKQMLQMLVAKLGGLLDRQIYHLPFSRDIKLNNNSLHAINQLLKECMNSGGILLTQPENILSFMLMGIESCISGDSKTSQGLVKILGRLDAHSRDIVDESDENFSVKFELLYTMGLQSPIQYSPERWICVQSVLEIFRKIIPEVQSQFPSSIEISRLDRGFPRTRVLQADAQDRIIIKIADEICRKGLTGFPIVRQQKEFRQAVFSYITEAQPSPTVISIVENDNLTGFWAKSRDALLLLRGLLAGGVLGFCFGQKRWRVDYGLDASRKPETKLAVPFRAKDNPTPRSEFSHPEVVMVLTQLSYYYGGLSNEELDLAFRHLLNSDQADVEFQAWVQGVSRLSDEFKQLSGINLEDRLTCEEEIFPHFRFSQAAINYFLSNNVFPKEMKEFPHKLSASGWDIGKIKTHPTTGFSGTNDSRAVLPLSVNQLDLSEQKHTNALVLENLLQPENAVALMPPHVDQEVSDAKMLLEMVIGMNPPVRVILDVGAQILELDNLGVAREWLLSIQDPEKTEAVVFFNANDELSVLDRKGYIEPLQVSSYINQLDLCLVFLDEAHTRGTELKLPQDYRAAVTLGAHLTKDRLVQACMRMRLLGEGQSVIFCVPHEISSKIQRLLPNVQSEDEPTISVTDILAWAITETWNDAKRNIMLWAAQGRRHEKHKHFWAQCHAAGNFLTKELAEKFLEDEAKSLEDRYRPLLDQDNENQSDDAIARRCRQFNNLELMSAVLQEEQERELAPEIEQERQDERPPLAQPARHGLHPDVSEFIRTGRLDMGSRGYMNAFTSLQGTSAASIFRVTQFRPGLLVSTDFARTVSVMASTGKLDGYQRPVQWVLTASQVPHGNVVHMMIISPYEANELLPEVQKSAYVALHLYAARPNLGYRSLDKLDLYTVPEVHKDREIPRRFITALNLFAGQLYLSSFDEYIEICKFLGLAWEPAKGGEIIGADGFIHRDYAGRVGGRSGLRASPVEFFKILLTKIRRNCESIDKTHMGQILDNRLLSPEDFE
ncbi:hypothetical protein E0Z10_g2449 [Xylaria hypoxylon]|uniref:ubiquitinyl hydrolase 1 n=1 Tax=Xylaria hypoxylon TaxID=37992 RepID=A0A4Z0Z3W1_9PEZI|nr:hypothetical protein E0Z10_g2449 [Xylaria hypoxylon]